MSEHHDLEPLDDASQALVETMQEQLTPPAMSVSEAAAFEEAVVTRAQRSRGVSWPALGTLAAAAAAALLVFSLQAGQEPEVDGSRASLEDEQASLSTEEADELDWPVMGEDWGLGAEDGTEEATDPLDEELDLLPDDFRALALLLGDES